MIDPTEFLRARLEEDKQLALAAAAGGPGVWTTGGHPGDECHIKGHRFTIYDEGGHDAEQADHIALHDPARVLREVEAKRMTLDVHHATRFGADGHPLNTDCCAVCCRDNPNGTGCDRAADDWPCVTVRLLALPYSDHPDYRKEWRP